MNLIPVPFLYQCSNSKNSPNSKFFWEKIANTTVSKALGAFLHFLLSSSSVRKGDTNRLVDPRTNALDQVLDAHSIGWAHGIRRWRQRG